jgi:hypothetical protein
MCFKLVIQSWTLIILVQDKNTSLKLPVRKSLSKLKSIPVGVSPLQLVNLHRNRRYFVIKLHKWFCLSYFLKTNIKFLLHLSILYENQQFFQHRICFSIQPQLQLVNLHRNRRYFVIKRHTWVLIDWRVKSRWFIHVLFSSNCTYICKIPMN